MTIEASIHRNLSPVESLLKPCLDRPKYGKRRRRTDSLLLTSISVQAILFGLFLSESSPRQWVGAFVITSTALRPKLPPLAFCCPQTDPYRRRNTRLWDSEVSSDGITSATISPNGSLQISNGAGANNNGSPNPLNRNAIGYAQAVSISMLPQFNLLNDQDTPRPTANGGFTHTSASRAKISAANKGKTPWNKGKSRSDEVRARIAAGVRAKNRERLLKKLEEMGLTEEDYLLQKKEEKRKREAEKRARRTANGGYKPTAETRAKISKALKEKHASGQVKKREVDLSKVRRGFTHSEETRRKISETLKKKWNSDNQYREHMTESCTKANSREETRRKIAESLRKRWADPEFREEMTKRMSTSRSGRGSITYDDSYRKKISDAMKKKWQDPEYREKTLTSIQKSAQNRTSSDSTPRRPAKKKTANTKNVGMQLLNPLSPADLAMRKKKKMAKKKKMKGAVAALKSLEPREGAVALQPLEPRKASTTNSKLKGSRPPSNELKSTIELEVVTEKKQKKKKRKKSKENDGSVTRLKEERRDLFDFLYGDEDSLLLDDDEDSFDIGVNGAAAESTLSKMGILLGDEDLDSFDPYGLDDY
jgi:NUMOD3 motif